MNGLTGKQIYLPMAMPVVAAMLTGTVWTGGDAFTTIRLIGNFVNDFGLRFGKHSLVYAADFYCARK